MFDADVSPYCFDFDDRKLLCVSTPDIAGATFFYQAQRRTARSVIKVPFDALPEAPPSPTLDLFDRSLRLDAAAPGVRGGRRALGIGAGLLHPGCALRARMTLRCAASSARATRLLPYAVIKLRAECNHAPLLIAGAFRFTAA